MKKETKVVTTSFSKVWLDEDGICRVVLMPGIVVGLVEMQENLAVQIKLQRAGKKPTLVDMRKIKNPTLEARNFAAGKEYGREVSAVAILQNTVIGKILGNLFINFSKPIYPTRLFTSEDTVDWLKGYLQVSNVSKPGSIGAKNGNG